MISQWWQSQQFAPQSLLLFNILLKVLFKGVIPIYMVTINAAFDQQYK